MERRPKFDPSSITLGKLFNFSILQFPHLWNKHSWRRHVPHRMTWKITEKNERNHAWHNSSCAVNTSYYFYHHLKAYLSGNHFHRPRVPISDKGKECSFRTGVLGNNGWTPKTHCKVNKARHTEPHPVWFSNTKCLGKAKLKRQKKD